MSELKPCPFCGGTEISTDETPVSWHEDKGMIGYGARCKCGASYWHPDAGEVNWNTRPADDALRAQVAALKEKCATLMGKYVCAYCERTFQPITTDQMREHIKKCPKHPLRDAEAKVAALKEQNTKLREDLLEAEINRAHSRGVARDFKTELFTARAQVALMGEALEDACEGLRYLQMMHKAGNIGFGMTSGCGFDRVYAKQAAALAAPEVVAVKDVEVGIIGSGSGTHYHAVEVNVSTDLPEGTELTAVILRREGAAVCPCGDELNPGQPDDDGTMLCRKCYKKSGSIPGAASRNDKDGG